MKKSTTRSSGAFRAHYTRLKNAVTKEVEKLEVELGPEKVKGLRDALNIESRIADKAVATMKKN
jgi:hypothetical protein